MNPTILAMSDEIIPILAIGGGLGLGFVGILSGVVRSVLRTKERERTRREVAAYVSEGTMTAEDAEKILRAGLSSTESCRG